MRLTLSISRPENSAAEFVCGIEPIAPPIRARQQSVNRTFLAECLNSIVRILLRSFPSYDCEERREVNTTSKSSGIRQRHRDQQRAAAFAGDAIDGLWGWPALRELASGRRASGFFCGGPRLAGAAD